MSTSARDYALPIDGNTHTIPCGPGALLAAEMETDADGYTAAFLWIHQDDTPRSSNLRDFTTRPGRDPWPDGARHLISLRADGETVHVLEVLP